MIFSRFKATFSRKVNWALLISSMFVMTLLSGCGEKQKEPADKNQSSTLPTFTHIYQNQAPFQEWVRERFQNIVLIHPPQPPQQNKLEDYAKIFSALARQTCEFLQIEPQDSIVIYFYTGLGHGLTVTGRETPFSDGHVIHFWFPSFYGPPIVKHLLPKWYDGEMRHKFLRDGIIALLDGSGENYHVATLKMLDSGTYIPLRRLSVDTTVNVDRERYQSAEVASFVDYIVYAYDISYLKKLYSSHGSFSAEVERIFMLPLPKLEERWHTFLRTFAGTRTSLKK